MPDAMNLPPCKVCTVILDRNDTDALTDLIHEFTMLRPAVETPTEQADRDLMVVRVSTLVEVLRHAFRIVPDDNPLALPTDAEIDEMARRYGVDPESGVPF